MDSYEIRLLRADKTTDAIIELVNFSDQSAIQAAKKIAEARPFEVWRDLECIYGRPSKINPPLTAA